jgi:hypothetical protein
MDTRVRQCGQGRAETRREHITGMAGERTFQKEKHHAKVLKLACRVFIQSQEDGNGKR